LRFDDTNPAKEEQEYVDAIKDILLWLGLNSMKNVMLHFHQLYDCSNDD
jgi:glutaminyl-tRNA synthetase